MRAVQNGPLIGLFAQLVLLVSLGATVGLDGYGWVVGITCGVVTNVALTRGLARYGGGLGPADRVTLTRATLVGGVAALTVDSFGRPAPLTTLVALTVVALVLDAVDGFVARRTRSVSTFGANFDMEVDAFLILVLSVYVARSAGAWVLAIGAARYAFFAAGWLLPWLRGPVPPRYWRKVVAATQGVVLTFAVADVLPRFVMDAALVGSLALLIESFGRDVWWLRANRRVEPGRVVVSTLPQGTEDPADGRTSGVRTAAAAFGTLLAWLLVWFALMAPNEIGRLTPSVFVGIPLEGLLVVVLAIVLPPRAGQVMAALVGVVLGLLTVVKLLDMGFLEALGRPFDPVIDWSYFGSAVGVLGDSIGRLGAILTASAVGALAIALLVLVPLSLGHLTRVVNRQRATSIRAVTALGVVWIVCAVFGVHIVSSTPIASTSAADLAYSHVSQIPAELHDQRMFARATAVDPLRNTPGDDLLTGLRGKDVIVAFVESYGRVAVQDSAFSPPVKSVLDTGARQLRAAGFSSQSAFLTSPTFGAISWLAHSTLQSGLWVDSQQRYDVLVASHRDTLSDAFKRAGWRTVSVVPSNDHDWPQGSLFYNYDKMYDARNVGYEGPPFSYATMPDQYTLSAFQRLELAKPNRAPVMAEIDLVSSHAPWTPLPHMIDWNTVGDGSVFDAMPAQGQSPEAVWPDPDKVRTVYAQSIKYSLKALFSFVQTYHDDNLVLVVLGDHQPATIVSGQDASHDVPISIIAHDPAVMDRISGWGWQNGMSPGPNAPVWPMDAFRDRFLTAYGPQPAPAFTTQP